ncbi:MAG TPA: 50S ribosomal protein L30 [Chloroflexota bacterium]|jgi:large subunit ribosomal protein L30
MATKLRVTQLKSEIGCTEDQRATVRSLGLHRIRQEVVVSDTPAIRGMLHKVRHLVQVAEEAEKA